MSQTAGPLRSAVFLLVSGAVGEGGHHVPPALGHCPAVLLSRALESAVSSGAVRVKGEHLLQVLKHVIKEPPAEATPLLKLPPLSVHSLPVGLEVAVEVSLLVGLVLGVEVVLVLVSLLLTKRVIVFEDVVKVEVEGLVVLVEVVVASSSSSALPWRRAVTKLVVLSPPLIIRQRLIS